MTAVYLVFGAVVLGLGLAAICAVIVGARAGWRVTW